MQTRKLYYEDCHIKTFSSTVLSCLQTDKGFEIILDATAFYPEGGGQGCDYGTLGEVRVLDVRERGETVVHLCDSPLPQGATVTGRIDWARRFDLMQQHTGEHIISGLIHKYTGLHNVGFHMGITTVTIDFDGPISPELLEKVEREANEAVQENLPIRCWYPSEQELPTVGYRSKKALPWPVRVVEVPGFDKCACCGVHVSHTGQIGVIKLLSVVKFHQGVRIEMVCGMRAFDYLSRVFEENRKVSQAFSAKPLETGGAAVRMNEQLASEKYRASCLEKQLYDYIAAAYLGKNADALHYQPGLSPTGVRELAERIAKACGGTAVVLSGSDGALDICMAHPGGDVKTLGALANKALNGRGGGKPGFFQGKLACTLEEAEAFFRENLN